MKNIYYSAFIGAFMLFTSCSDFLDQDNRSDVDTKSFYNTTTGYESLTNQMYSSLRTIFNNQPHLFVGGTDLYGDGKSQGMSMTYYTYTVSEDCIDRFYKNCYIGIQKANEVIAYGETTADSSVRLQYIDEARFIRAWYYFQLVQQFGGVPIANEMYESAVMNFPRNSLKEVYDFIISEFEYLANSSKLQSESNIGRANKKAANFFLAKAYLTRGWLNGQDEEVQEDNIAQDSDFSNALKYSLVAIDNTIPGESIETAFDIANEQSSEFFWTVQYSGASVNNPRNDGSYQMSQFGAYLGGAEYPRTKSIDGTYSPTYHFHSLFAKGDGRYEQTFMLEFYGTTKDGTPTYKYFDYYYPGNGSKVLYYYAPWWATDEDIAAWRADDPNGVKKDAVVGKIALTEADGGLDPNSGKGADWATRRHSDCGVPCMRKFDDYTETSISNRSSTCSMHDVSCARLGEAYLIAAEAYLMQNDKNNAAKMINTLRQRPGTIKSGYEDAMTVTADKMTIDFILDERARELAGEYVRWTDLKRTHKLIEYVTKYQEDPIQVSNLKGSDGKYKILRPIPQSAIDKNKDVITQNPGY